MPLLLRVSIAILGVVSGAVAGGISASNCKRTFTPAQGSQYVGRAGWEDKAGGGILGTSENGTAGRTVMTCTVKLASSDEVVLDFGGARVSFTGPRPDSTPNGLTISIGSPSLSSVCELDARRVATEDWIQLGPAVYSLPLGGPADRVTVTFTLVDESRSAAVRADVGLIRIRPRRNDEQPRSCPPTRSR